MMDNYPEINLSVSSHTVLALNGVLQGHIGTKSPRVSNTPTRIQS